MFRNFAQNTIHIVLSNTFQEKIKYNEVLIESNKWKNRYE